MALKVLTLLLVALIGTEAAPQNDVLQQWKAYQVKFEKTYKSPVEAQRRFEIFRENLEKIAAHNALYRQGFKTYEQGITSFADWTSEEFQEYIGDNEAESFANEETSIIEVTGPVPDSIDWRTKGAVTDVKNQGKCGSCYAFSTTGAIEGQLAIRNGNKVVLSEQDIIDCATQSEGYQCNGCINGRRSEALRYVFENGITTEEKYPYTDKNGTCKQVDSPIYYINGYDSVKSNEKDVKKIVGTKGPVSAAIDTTANLQHYKAGIFYENPCKGPNHAILIVGYGSEGQDDYWIVKNTWGKKWGENGYFRLARNKGNACDIAKAVFIPKL